MKKENPIKLKKYLFLISIVFCVITFSHILWNYLYENSETKPKKGGTISEGIIGKFPTLNPLKPLSGNNEYVLKYMYRSLLTYDVNQKKIVGDITKCDLSSLINIDCVINDNAKWSNGEKIKSDDIVSTYNLIKETNSNPTIASILKDVEIEANGNRIIFKNTEKDINFLNIFFQPIISQETINSLTKQNIEGAFPYKGGIYSGDYVLEDITTDENLGISKLILSRNEDSDANISKIIIYVFPDENNLKVNKQVVNIFNDEFNIIGESVPRFNSNKYNLPQFLSIFINSSIIENTSLRTIILNEINRDNLIKLLGKTNYKEVYNPFFTEQKTKIEPKNPNLESIMKSLGYKKKALLIQELKKGDKPKEDTKTGSVEETKEAKPQKIISEEKLDRSGGIDRYQKASEIINSPDWVDKYNFITKDDFKIIGNADSQAEAVYINDYKLQGFSAGDKEFFYRVKEDYGNIKEGENNYKIYFEKDGKKELKEEVNFLYYKDKTKLDAETEKFINSLYDKEEAEIQKNNEEVKKEAENTKEEVKETKEENVNIDNKELKKLESLDDKLFYDKDLKPYTLNLIYLNSRKDFDETANFIKNSLKEIGITVELEPLPKKEFSNALIEKKYDLILGGIDLGYFGLNIFPYFHSSQANSGFNYSAIKRTSLDLIIEEAKENIYNEEKEKEIKNKIIDIFKEEQIFKTLYSPKMNLLVDKNIKLLKNIEYLPSENLRNEIIEESYIKQERVFSLKGKSFSGFIAYLFKKLYE